MLQIVAVASVAHLATQLFVERFTTDYHKDLRWDPLVKLGVLAEEAGVIVEIRDAKPKQSRTHVFDCGRECIEGQMRAE